MAALDSPRSTRELADILMLELREAWAEEEHGATWAELEGSPIAKLSAASWGTARGTPLLQPWTIYPRLRKLERAGLVERIQIKGHRPLWKRADG